VNHARNLGIYGGNVTRTWATVRRTRNIPAKVAPCAHGMLAMRGALYRASPDGALDMRETRCLLRATPKSCPVSSQPPMPPVER